MTKSQTGGIRMKFAKKNDMVRLKHSGFNFDVTYEGLPGYPLES